MCYGPRGVNALMFVENLQREAVRERGAEVRVLHVHSGNLYGGIETFLRTVARHRTAAKSVTMDFALCFSGRIERELRDAGASVHMLGAVRLRSPRTVRAARATLESLLKSGRYDVVICHSLWTHAVFAPAVRRYGLPLVHHMHDVATPGGWIDRLANLTSPDLVVTNSVFTQMSNPWLFSGTARRLVRYPAETNVNGERSDRATVRASLGTTPGQVVILQASRMQSWKGQHLLIEALGALRDNPRWVCWMAGGAQRPREIGYEKQLRAAVKRLKIADRIKFLGQRDDVPALMRAADVYCQPNAGPEPFGLVFVEALAAGLPVVTTRMGGPMEIVDASCGILVPPDARALAEALRELVDDDGKQARLSRGGPSRARALCDPEARMGELGRVMANLVIPQGSMDVVARAALSDGRSSNVIQSVAMTTLRDKAACYDVIVDLGCGRGDCARTLEGMYDLYLGCDAVAYDGFPRGSAPIEFRKIDLNRPPYALADASAAAVVSVETIEHLENPRAFMREIARIVRPGGYVVVTTPNQLSLMSKLNLLVRNQFYDFQEAPGLYPAHITALLEEDLRRIAKESGLTNVEIRYTDHGRIPLTSRHWPSRLGARGRWFSDNVVMVARRP
jgi:glycosyltransferase involved in cell wall biosynthesis/2-polyprenyl-3-methyl-5-hydroxy-6-metoxy-1,4-benzoquinol methylase